MSDLRNEAIKRAVLLLQASKAKFKVIAEDGTEYGDLAIAPPVSGIKRKRMFKSGELQAHYKPYLDKLEPGDLASIPILSYPPESLRSAITAAACNRWGKGSAMSCVREDNVELLRIQ